MRTPVNPDPVRVRAAEPRDAEFVLGLVPQLLAFGPPSWRDARQMLETDTHVVGQALQHSPAGAVVLIAEDSDSNPVGFIHLCAETDYYTQRDCGHIADLVVAPAARGRGVGEALMAAAEQWARSGGYAMLSLNVFLTNTPARGLYERLGFAPETVRYVKTLV